jgi:spermidine synthase
MCPDTFVEFYDGKTGLSLGIKQHLYSQKSHYQQIDVFETEYWGKLLVLDGLVMLSEGDEFVYHEMISHVGLFTHRNPKTVLIIGGGDGGTAREVLKHQGIEHVDLVEIDKMVIDVSKEYFPNLGNFADRRLTVHIKDGVEFLLNRRDTYDLIIVDGSDPVGPAEGLFSETFYNSCLAALRKGGVMTAQMESPWVRKYHQTIQQSYQSLAKCFSHVGLYLCPIPLYPTGLWAMVCASNGESADSDSVTGRCERGESELEGLRYYSAGTHRASFCLPPFVREMIQTGPESVIQGESSNPSSAT